MISTITDNKLHLHVCHIDWLIAHYDIATSIYCTCMVYNFVYFQHLLISALMGIPNRINFTYEIRWASIHHIINFCHYLLKSVKPVILYIYAHLILLTLQS